MPRVIGIDHLVIRVGDFERSKRFYGKLLGFLGFALKYDLADAAGWSNGKTLFWIGEADEEGKKRPHRIGDIGFHHYAFELARREDVDALDAFLRQNGANVVDPAGEYYPGGYYAVYFTDPDGLKLEGMHYPPPQAKPARKAARKAARRTARKPASRRAAASSKSAAAARKGRGRKAARKRKR
jgi:catechol 2,3-dioxygenase-like lactoylglutathione lyase family enzyme